MIKRPFIGIFLVLAVLSCSMALGWKGSLHESFSGIAKGRIEGVVFEKKEKAVSIELHLRNSLFYEEKSGRTFKIGTILVYYSNPSFQGAGQRIFPEEQVQIGNRVEIDGALEAFLSPSNPGQFDEKFYYESRGYFCKAYGEGLEILDGSKWEIPCLLRDIRQKIGQVYERNMNLEEAGIVKAMALGEKAGLSKDLKEQYQQAGIGHLMAISGLHITFIGMGFYGVLLFIGISKKYSCILSALFIWLYGLMTGFGISTNRAVVMLTLSLLAGVVGRTYDMASALMLSGSLILLQKPLLLFDCGFLLSFGAVAGIGLLYPSIEKILSLQKTVVKSIFASLSIQLATLPIILFFYYEIPVFGIFLNIFVIPLMSLVLALSLLGGFLGLLLPAFPFLARFFLGGVSVILQLYEKSAKLAMSLPFSRLVLGRPKLWQIVIYYVLLAVLAGMLYRKAKEENARKPSYCRKEAILLLFALLAVVAIPVCNWDRGRLEMTFLDVGQGDCIFIRSKKGMTCLVDGGSSDVKGVGTYRILPFLKAKGIGSLDYVMVTHTDSDHMNGVAELLEKSGTGGVKIKNLVLPKAGIREENYKWLLELAKKREIPVIFIKAGDVLMDGRLTVTCLHPAAEFQPGSANSYSMVLEVSYGSFKALLTGDLEERGEQALFENGSLKDVSLLKVAHHGSRYSTSESFLEKTRPEISVISYGKGNLYGHPHKELLERLLKAGCQGLETAKSGAVTVKTDGQKLWVEKFREEELYN